MKKIGFNKYIYVSVALAIFFLFGAFIFSVYRAHIRDISYDVEKQLKTVKLLFEKQLSSDTILLNAIIEMLTQNPDVRAAWLAGDRATLLNLTSPLLSDFYNKHRITHFYFHDAKRVNFLRVYKPEKYGDLIDRHVLLKAEETGKPFSGLELGLFGTFTLRAVHPWWINNQLVGYIEMGEEIDHIADKLREVLGVELYISIYKEYLDHDDWKEGMQMLGRQDNWDLSEGSVIISQTLNVVPQLVADLLSAGHHQYMEFMGPELSIGDKFYRVGFMPLFDVDDREVGDISVLWDVTSLSADAENTILIASAISAIVGVILFVSFFTIMGRIEDQLTGPRSADEGEQLLPAEHKAKESAIKLALTKKYSSPLRIVFSLMISIFFVELLVMVFLHILPPLPPLVKIFIDSFLLIGLVSPILYFFVFRPLILQVSRREQAEEGLQLFRNLIDQSNDAIFVIDPETGRFLDANNKACAGLGYTRGELLSHGVADVDTAFMDNSSWDKHVRQMREKIDMVIEGVHRRKDDTTFPVEISVKYIVQEGGGYIVAVARDITERKQAEEKLISAYQTTRNILEKAPYGIYVVNTEGKIEYVNPAMIKIAGEEYGQFKKINTFNLFTYRKIGLSEKIKAGLEGRYFRMDAVEYTSHYGQKTTFRNFIGIPLIEEDENKVLMVVEDITEAKQVEQELVEHRHHLEELVETRTVELKKINKKLKLEIDERKQAEEVLLMEKQRLDNVSNYANCGLFLLDDQARITYANKFAEEWFGPLDEIEGKPCWQVFGQKDPEKECSGLKVLRTGKTVRSDTLTELLHGEKKHFYVVASPVRDSTGRIHQISEIVIDITERKQAEKKLKSYQKKLRSLTSELSLAEERERRRIATDLHDYIGQSLAISKIKLGAMHEEAPSDGFAKSLMEVKTLVSQAIKYTRSLMTDLSPPILYELGFEAAVEWLTEQTYKQHEILCEFEDDNLNKPLDDEVRVVLFQAVRELLINIAKHGQAGSAKVLLKKSDTSIRIEVEDDGVGFDTSQISHYGDDTGGFGLFNIRERLDYLGGRLSIKSKPGQGTRVTLMAPLKSDKKITKNITTEEYMI